MSKDSSKPVIAEVTEEAAPASGIRWSVFTAVVVLVLGFVLSQLFGSLLVSIYPHLKHWNGGTATNWLDNSIGAQFLYVLISEILLVMMIAKFVQWRKGKFGALGVKKPKWIDVAYASFGILAYLGLYLVAVDVVSAIVHINEQQQQDLGFSNPAGGVAMLLTFISLVILPPLAEEFAFRGFLFSTLRRRFSLVIAMLGTSALFAVPHLLESGSGGLLWIAGIDTFVLSLVLCYVREKTGRLWAGMIIHGLKNSIAFVYIYAMHMH
jgi:hypothetical protein